MSTQPAVRNEAATEPVLRGDLVPVRESLPAPLPQPPLAAVAAAWC